MRDGWKSVRLDEVFAVSTAKLGVHTEEPAVFAISKYDGVVLSSDYHDHRVASAKLDGYKVLAIGGWAYSTIHIDEGSIARNNYGIQGVVSPMYTILKWISEDCVPAYFEYLLRTSEMLTIYKDMAQGSINRRRSLPWKTFSAIEVEVPPLQEQQRIVDLIGSLDEAVEAADDAIGAAQGAFSQVRRQLVNQDRQPLRPLSDFVEFASGSSFPPAYQGVMSGLFPFYKVSDMNSPANKYTMSESNNWISDDTRATLRCRIWPKGTVIFPKVGAALSTEKRRILSQPAAFDNNIMGLVAGPGILPSYLLLFMEQIVLGELAQVGPVPSVNQSHIASLRIAVPSLEKQQNTLSLTESHREQVTSLVSYATSLRTLRSNLLTVLLSGEHEIPESYDVDTTSQFEPAA